MNEVFTKEQLVQYITRIEKLEEDKKIIGEDMKELLQDAKNNGFDIKTMKHILKLRRMDREKLAEEDALIELYREAVGV
jgi:uncharacterized protein (UPF0335 family)